MVLRHKIKTSSNKISPKTTMKVRMAILLSSKWSTRRQGRSQNFQGGGGPADTNNYDRFDAPIALNTSEV